MKKEIRSYTSGQSLGTLAEFFYLFRGVYRASQNMAAEVAEPIGQVRELERLVAEFYGLELRDLDMLEVGVGQLPRQIAYFARNNRVVGIDLDVIPRGFDIPSYYRLLRSNGPKRLLKTVSRKLLGMDRRFHRSLCRELEVQSLPDPQLLTMDAIAMEFPDRSFDFVYSLNVFEHLPDPQNVLGEIRRVLRPGGCVVTHLHLFTSDSGCHDLRILFGNRENVPYWPHLRPRHNGVVNSAAYINRYRIARWHEVFKSVMPESQFVHWHDKDKARKLQLINELREAGELGEYTDEELLTVNFLAFWRKPVN